MVNIKKYKKVVILSGGISDEYEISKLSATAVYKVLNNKYNCKLINVGDDIINLIKKLKSFNPDIIFNCLHGYFGEDGQIQSILNLLGFPYTHSGVLASSMSMDKRKSKVFFKGLKISVPDEIDPLNKKLNTFPIITKPINGGSSNGIKIIKNKDELNKFIKKVGINLQRFIFEEFINGREITVGIINNKVCGIMEIKFNSPLYDYDRKYVNVAKHIINPKLSKKIIDDLKKASINAHNAIGCNCVSRVDFRYDEKKKKIYLLEINTQPGLTNLSLLPEMAKTKISFFELCEILINNPICEKY